MALIKTIITANGNYKIDTVKIPRDADFYLASIMQYGNFGGGALALNASPDQGVTLVPVINPSTGSQYSTAIPSLDKNIQLGGAGGIGNEMQLYVTLTGAASPSINVNVYNNS